MRPHDRLHDVGLPADLERPYEHSRWPPWFSRTSASRSGSAVCPGLYRTENLIAHRSASSEGLCGIGLRLADKPLVARVPKDGRVHLKVACRKRDKGRQSGHRGQ
jgi:hypothetical protein